MTITVSRRQRVTAVAMVGAALACPDALFAATGAPAWTLGVADVDADIPLQTLQRLQGKAPAGLAGTPYRNGPAKFRRATQSGHWFDGDGLMCAFSIGGDGDARLTARFADTPKRRTEAVARQIMMPGFGTPAGHDQAGTGSFVTGPDDTDAANTSVIMAGSELLPLWEAGSPLRMDPATLTTRGFKTFRSDLAQMPFLAHPRIEPDGRIWDLSVSGKSALVWRIDADGGLEGAQSIKLPRMISPQPHVIWSSSCNPGFKTAGCCPSSTACHRGRSDLWSHERARTDQGCPPKGADADPGNDRAPSRRPGDAVAERHGGGVSAQRSGVRGGFGAAPPSMSATTNRSGRLCEASGFGTGTRAPTTNMISAATI